MAATFQYRESKWDRIVGVGWGGRMGLINITHVSGPGSPLIVAYGSEEDATSLIPPDLNGIFTVGAEVPRSLWTDEEDPQGVLSVRTSTARGQLVNFTRLAQREKLGSIVGNSIVTPGAEFSVNLKIYSGGTITVGPVVGGYLHFADTGGTLHYDETRTFTTLPHSVVSFFSFDKDGFLGGSP